MSNPSSISPGFVARALDALVSQIPASREKPHPEPENRARELARSAARRAAATSGTFTLPGGPLGFATVLPDLVTVWRIQQQLVADIAATFGRNDALTREVMLLCLFKHGGAALSRALLSRGAHDHIVVHRIATRALHQLLEKIAVRLAQRLAAKSASRWIPLVGAVGAGAYSYHDTTLVAGNAIELFSAPFEISADPAPSAREESDGPEASGSPRHRARASSSVATSPPAAQPSRLRRLRRSFSP